MASDRKLDHVHCRKSCRRVGTQSKRSPDEVMCSPPRDETHHSKNSHTGLSASTRSQVFSLNSATPGSAGLCWRDIGDGLRLFGRSADECADGAAAVQRAKSLVATVATAVAMRHMVLVKRLGADRAVIGREYPLEAIAHAYRSVESGQTAGNVIVNVKQIDQNACESSNNP